MGRYQSSRHDFCVTKSFLTAGLAIDNGLIKSLGDNTKSMWMVHLHENAQRQLTTFSCHGRAPN
jgi:hypothetical protein